MKILSYDTSIDYRTFYIYDPAHDSAKSDLFCDFNDVHIQQGFCGYSGAFAFFVITDSSPLHIEIIVNEQPSFNDNTVRAIQVPFTAISQTGVIAEALLGQKVLVDIPPGEYSLIFEQGYQNEKKKVETVPDAAESSFVQLWTKEEIDEEEEIDETYEEPLGWCRVWFTSTTNIIEAKILVQKVEADINHPINPVYPSRIELPPKHAAKTILKIYFLKNNHWRQPDAHQR